MTTLEKIQTILLEYGNASLSYGMELNNGDWVECDPKRNLFWYLKLHTAPTIAGYTEEVINDKDDAFLQRILRQLKNLAIYEERKDYREMRQKFAKKINYLKSLTV